MSGNYRGFWLFAQPQHLQNGLRNFSLINEQQRCWRVDNALLQCNTMSMKTNSGDYVLLSRQPKCPAMLGHQSFKKTGGWPLNTEHKWLMPDIRTPSICRFCIL